MGMTKVGTAFKIKSMNEHRGMTEVGTAFECKSINKTQGV